MVVTRSSERTLNGRRTRAVVATAMTDIERMRLDAGVSLARLARGAGIDAGYLTQVIAGDRLPSVPVLVALARALGANLSIRAYPTTGPNIHDKIQAPIIEELVRIAHPTWAKSVEVQVFRPARGFIDVVLDSAAHATIVATEVESRIDRLEQQIRWAQDKAASLPSSKLWQHTSGDRTVHRLLVLRNTAATRAIAKRFVATLRTAYPARAADVYAALTAGAPWPGDGILWADVHEDEVRIRERPPRGVDLGR